MKKLGLLLTTILLVLTLVACGGNKLHATMQLGDLDPKDNSGIGENEIEFTAKLIDPDDQIGDQIEIIFTLLDLDKNKPEEQKTVKRSKARLADNEDVYFGKLKIDNDYQLEISTTFNGKNVVFYKHPQVIRTKTKEKLEIKTPEDFLKIKENLYGEYTLINDIDFTGYEDDILKNLVGNFRGIFNGNGKTIKNYRIVPTEKNKNGSTNSSLGLFGQLSGKAKVHDLTIEGFEIKRIFPTTTSGTSSYIGILFGQNSSATVNVDNIVIKDSKLDLQIDSSSNYLKFGMLGGTASGKFNNIEIQNTNTLDINFKKHRTVFIGGVVGELTSTAQFKQVLNAGKISLNIDQTGEEGEASKSGLVANSVEVQVGGFAGNNKEAVVENTITKTDITVNDIKYSIENNGTDDEDTSNKYVYLYVGGLFGKLTTTLAKDMVYEGNIEVLSSLTFVNNLKEKDKDEEGNEIEDSEAKPVELRNHYEFGIHLGGLVGNTTGTNRSLNNLIRKGGSISIVEQNADGSIDESDFKLSYHSLFGSASKITYDENNRFGLSGTQSDTYNGVAMDITDIRVINDLLEYFKDNEWMLNNL